MATAELARELRREARTLVEDARAFLASPEGEHLRRIVATGLIVAAPFVSRLPVFRASRLGRLVGLAGGAAVIVKLANMIRDWEPTPIQAV
ncbi:MAG TPA: hypothetical protein VE915_09190 [Actinomycetota bacterium]|nr:hypothetical protein [Actinomycetota bacterium]